MQLVVGVLACIAAGVLSVAVADPAPEQSAHAASSPSTNAAAAPVATATTPGAQASPAPAAAPTSAATAPVKPAVDPEEKRLISMGYRPEMRNGEKVFCRLVEETGSRLGGKKQCGTPKELTAAQTATREEVEKAQRLQGMPVGK